MEGRLTVLDAFAQKTCLILRSCRREASYGFLLLQFFNAVVDVVDVLIYLIYLTLDKTCIVCMNSFRLS